MTLAKRDGYWYGTTAADAQAELARYARANGYPATRSRSCACVCGHDTFRLESDEDAGVAKRTCAACGVAAWMGDSAAYAAEAHVEAHECVCDADVFELTCGVSLYAGSNDVRWFYIGCRCVRCQLVGVFADWKCEAGDADAFLAST